MEKFQSNLVKHCKGHKHSCVAAVLGVPLWTLRNWLYGRNQPNRFTRDEVLKRIRTISK